MALKRYVMASRIIIIGHDEPEIKVQTEKVKWNHNLGHR